MSKYIRVKLAGGDYGLKYIDDNNNVQWILMNEDNEMYQEFLSSGQEYLDE